MTLNVNNREFVSQNLHTASSEACWTQGHLCCVGQSEKTIELFCSAYGNVPARRFARVFSEQLVYLALRESMRARREVSHGLIRRARKRAEGARGM
jgi:hypothetical protein